jgi:hypothetical protein
MRATAPVVVRERDAAAMLGVSTAALRRWRRERRGPAFIRIEGCIGYRLADLEDFLSENTVAIAPKAVADDQRSCH